MICIETFFPKKPVDCIHESVIKLRLALIRLLFVVFLYYCLSCALTSTSSSALAVYIMSRFLLLWLKKNLVVLSQVVAATDRTPQTTALCLRGATK